MMIKVEAIVREEKFEDVKAALNEIEVNGITVSQVMGCGAQRGYKEIVRGSELRFSCSRKSNLKLLSLPKNGRKKQSKQSRKLPIPVKSVMVRSSAMKSGVP